MIDDLPLDVALSADRPFCEAPGCGTALLMGGRPPLRHAFLCGRDDHREAHGITKVLEAPDAAPGCVAVCRWHAASDTWRLANPGDRPKLLAGVDWRALHVDVYPDIVQVTDTDSTVLLQFPTDDLDVEAILDIPIRLGDLVASVRDDRASGNDLPADSNPSKQEE